MGQFKELQQACLYHKVPLLIKIFPNRLVDSLRIAIDVAAGRTLTGKSLYEAYELLEDMINANY